MKPQFLVEAIHLLEINCCNYATKSLRSLRYLIRSSPNTDSNWVLSGSIPNPEAKPFSADGTALVKVWGSRTSPDNYSKRGHLRVALFYLRFKGFSG
jgi:hypothetical protein